MKTNYQQRPEGSHRISMAIAAVFLLTALVACTPGLSVRSDSDPGADFSSFKTYNFFDPMGVEAGYNSPIFGEYFRDALSGEMNRRGYRISDQPDLLINVTLRSDDKVQIRYYNAPYLGGAYYDRPGGAYYGSALGVGVAVGTSTTVTTEASVFIDFVDSDKHQVVWQGVAVADVNDKVAQKLRDAIFTSVNKVLAEYPHTAGK
ncbi:MAG: DUF4136 domain-containing protein [Lysobacterales bacterium]